MKTIRWGVLGYARIARLSVLPAIAGAEGCSLRAIGSRDPAKLAEAQRQFRIEHGYASYDAVLSDPEVDAVYIPLPNSLHREWTLRAAAAGKHVLCEKPLGLNREEAEAMVAAGRRAGVLLMEGFMYRYTDRIRAVLDVVRSGRLGKVRLVESSFRFLLDRPDSIKLQPGLGGGSLYDVGCYPVHFCGLIADAAAGLEPGAAQVVSACCEKVMDPGISGGNGAVDQLAAAVLRFDTGLVGTVGCGFNAHKRVHSTIVGTDGVLEVPDTFFGNAGAITLIRGEEQTPLPVAESDRYRLEILDFADAIRSGRAPAVTAAETLRNASALDRLLR